MTDVPFHKDIGKRVSDLLTKEFPSEKQENKVEWKGKADNNVTFETSFLTKKDGSIVGTFVPKYEFKEYGTTVSAELTTAREYKAEVAVKDQLTKGLKTTFTGQAKGDDQWSTIAFEYKQDYVALTGSVEYGKAAGSTVKGSAALGANGWAAGVSAEYFVGFTQDSDLKELNSVLSYAGPAWDAAAFGRMKSLKDDSVNELGLNYFHKVNRDLTVGAEVVFDTANAEAKPKLAFGGQYAFSDDTAVKAKLDTAGRLGLSWAQRYNKNAKIVLATTLDTNALGAKAASTLGFTLSLND